MNSLDFIETRLSSHRLLDAPFEKAVDVVDWLCAVQSQDYTGAKWALGLRANGLIDAQVDEAFDKGEILRTHVMRPTWHFVTPKDIGWMLQLTAPRIFKILNYYNKKVDLDEALLRRTDRLIAEALRGGNFLTRDEIITMLQKHGIATEEKNKVIRGAHILMYSELHGTICSGGKKGKQFTYALMEERAPQTKNFDREEALAEMTFRYFRGHGPAMIKDFVWWSGLTVADAKLGVELNKKKLTEITIKENRYWFVECNNSVSIKSPHNYLLSNYDEYTCYSDHSLVSDPEAAKKYDMRYVHYIVINGKIVGGWKRVITKNGYQVIPQWWNSPTRDEKEALVGAAERYSKFLGIPVVLG
jgi:hypothetical protein